MSFRFSKLYIDDVTSYIFKTEDQKILVNIDSTLNFIFAYSIEELSYEPFYCDDDGELVQLDTPHFLLKYTIYIKDSENNLWESSFVKDTNHLLEIFSLTGYNYSLDNIKLYQDIDKKIKQNIEQNYITKIYISNDSRDYQEHRIRNQTTFIGVKRGNINFTIYANLLNTKDSYLKQDIDDIELYIRADEFGEERYVADDYIFPQILQYGSFTVPSLCSTFRNPIHQVLNDSLVNQFYSYFSKKKLNTLIFTKSTEVIEDLPVCFSLVDKKDFKPDFIE